MFEAYFDCRSFNSPKIPSAKISENPMIALSGVRSSWLMLAKKPALGPARRLRRRLGRLQGRFHPLALRHVRHQPRRTPHPVVNLRLRRAVMHPYPIPIPPPNPVLNVIPRLPRKQRLVGKLHPPQVIGMNAAQPQRPPRPAPAHPPYTPAPSQCCRSHTAGSGSRPPSTPRPECWQ